MDDVLANRVAITGSRHYPNKRAIDQFIAELPPDTVVVLGAAGSVETWAADSARSRKVDVLTIVGKGRRKPEHEDIIAQAGRLVAFWDGRSRDVLNVLLTARYELRDLQLFGPMGEMISPYRALWTAIDTTVLDRWAIRREKRGYPLTPDLELRLSNLELMAQLLKEGNDIYKCELWIPYFEVGEGGDEMAGGPAKEAGWYVQAHGCGEPMCCGMDGPFPTRDAALDFFIRYVVDRLFPGEHYKPSFAASLSTRREPAQE
jgi:hypothetical protein